MVRAAKVISEEVIITSIYGGSVSVLSDVSFQHDLGSGDTPASDFADFLAQPESLVNIFTSTTLAPFAASVNPFTALPTNITPAPSSPGDSIAMPSTSTTPTSSPVTPQLPPFPHSLGSLGPAPPGPPHLPPPPMLLVADLDDDTYEPPLDATPPVITLNGAVQIELRQLDSYVDAGATAYDADTGLFVSVTVRGLEELEECLADTTCNTTDSTRGPFLIVYAAEDASGNQAAAVVRQVEVATFCPPPAYLCEDAVGRECATCETVEDSDTGEAREFCVCLGYNIDAAPTVKVEAYKSPADLLPPVLTLHGEAPLGITSSGTVVMLHTVLEGEVWSDPGVDAWDETDGNLSQVVTSFGGGAVDTSLARPDPFVITYSVSDAAENAAVEVQRRVHVINPCAGGAEAEETGEAEYICHYDESTKEVVCSENGLCSSLQLSAEEEETAPVPEPPALQRFGPRTISISEGDALYTVCPADGEEIGQICDPGVSAIDALDGDISAHTLACSPDGLTIRLAVRGVSGCGVDTSVPGLYPVTFSVTNSAGLTASDFRNVTVTPGCSTGETLCRLGHTCSIDGVCLDDLSQPQEEEAEEEPPPTISLLSTGSVSGGYVEVRQHQGYIACTAEALAADPEALCEPGVVAYDASQREVTSQVIVCPPESCLGRTRCAGHEWVRKGIQGCLNTSAEVGTIFEIKFEVFDSWMPAQSAGVTRYVSIIQPCELGEELCDDLTCSDVPCETRDSWSTAPADTTPPVITLLQPSPVQLTYGNASAAAELRPCEQSPSVDADPPCVATAQDDQSGDVSATLVVTQDHACSSCSTAGCLLERVHLCLSGTYGYLFEAEDEAGNRGIARLLVTVVEAAELDAGVILSADTSVIAEAEAQAALLLNSSSPEARAFAQGMAELLNTASTTAGEPLTASDIRITRVIVQTAGALLDEEQPSAELSLVVSFTTRVAVAGVAGEAVRRRLLKDDNGSALTSRTDDMAEIYAAAAQDGRMTASLDEAAVMATISLGNVLGLVGPVESTPLSPEVDVAGAWAVSIEAEILGLQAQGSQLSTATQRIRDTLTNAGGDPDVWRAHLLEVWFKAQQGDFERLDSLLASIEELKVKYTLSFMRAQLVQANQIDAQIALQEAVGSIQNIAEASQERAAAVSLKPAHFRTPGYTSHPSTPRSALRATPLLPKLR
ncbi:hypothetical protein CYMTET_37812 [Cymbomonas tetramitiformis]|uniref:HYR domain-containing protein n=1 Tax=Cymbomonas tetramitiformis TaxID=36881 RepID=A0AAE0F5K9_9CHLO|nr:hypothetical protein CYMTET_37812 [Cymbomonas tetramitiformis]